MKKSIILAAVAALVLAGCAKNETFVKSYDKDAVSFGAYSGRTITKAGTTDDMNLEALKKADAGFGVFATYTALADFSAADDNFMKNEKITWNGTDAWTYSPVKYWPNPTNGQSADDQKVSFFAYAPYANPTGVDGETGITGFTIEGGHNIVNYTFAVNKPNVDLMWGYKAKDTSTNPATYTVNENLTRPATTNDKVAFIFQHVLSKLGGSQDGTVTNPDSTGYVANGLIIKANAETIKPYKGFGDSLGTKITVSKIIVESAPATTEDPTVKDIKGQDVEYATGIQKGKLDLYTGKFTLETTAQAVKFKQTLTNDPNEISANPATADSELAERIAEPSTVASFAKLPKGVTETAVNVYKDESNPIILVPGTKPVVDVTITYIVRTWDEKLPNKYTEVPQTVFGRVQFPKIEENKKYNLLMILGLNDVKFEATVEDWTVVGQTWNDANGNGVVDAGELSGTETTIGLPSNL
jgi:hypothetical protein